MQNLQEVSIGGGQDEVIWNISLIGHYSMKETYEALRVTKQPVSWHQLIWFSNRIPRHSFIAWMAVQGGLKTLSKLREWGVVHTSTCPMLAG
ncbi:hypothetical protein FRX31_002302 [Thalictrum thalictroides]|uniref:Reverse transcriptase zinc-binding domain-containing protein n=1 Tax=Thalictrum thalictroides TaxID=46969 RepID=A0A7J6XEE7_THATH|nr:hypothetical protein FRX31_002302 [Thalictrum thalictroides]